MWPITRKDVEQIVKRLREGKLLPGDFVEQLLLESTKAMNEV